MTQPITYTAYRIALMIIESEDFELKIDKDKDGNKVFKLVDDNSANWGDIESDEFYNLATVIDRLEAYHDDYYFKEFEEKRNPDILSGKILPDLSDGKPFEYDMALSLVDRYDRDTDEECLDYYVSKMLFHILFKTLSAYRVVECNNHIYCTAYDDAKLWKSDKELCNLIYKQVETDLCNFDDWLNGLHSWLKENFIYESTSNDSSGRAYRQMLEREEEQIVDDLKDLGKEGHYFDEYAFAYLGLLDEYDKA